MGLQLNWESACLADKRLRVRSSSIPPLYPELAQFGIIAPDLGSGGHRFKSCIPDHIRTCTYFFCFGSRCLLVQVQPSRPLLGSRQIGKAGDYQSGHYAPLTQLADVASSNLAFSQFESGVEYHNKNAKFAIMLY